MGGRSKSNLMEHGMKATGTITQTPPAGPRAAAGKGYVDSAEVDARSWKDRIGRTAWIAGWVATAVLFAAAFFRLVWHDGLWPLLIVNSYTPLFFAPAWVILPLAIWKKKFRMAGVAALCAMWHMWCVAPMSVAAEPPPAAAGPQLRLATCNLLTNNWQTDALLDELEAQNPDVLVLQEVSPLWVRAIEERGWNERFPHQIVEPRVDAFGAAILSRIAPTEAEIMEVDGLPWPRMVIPHGDQRIEVLNVHTLPPRTAAYTEGHRRQLDVIARWAMDDGRQNARMLVGDFNSTPWSLFHSQIGEQFDDAWDLAGDGLGHTWPNGLFNLPPARLDHVYMTRELTVTDVQVGTGTGSDHRPIIVDLAWRR